MNTDMCNSAKYLIVFLAAVSSAFAQCNLGDLQCCLAEFDSIVSPAGIKLSEQRLAGVCTQKDETLNCLDLFLDQCLRNESDSKEVENIVNKTQAYIMAICPPTSDFMSKLKESETCILNSTSEFQACYNKSVSPIQVDQNMESTKKECCQYKELRNCATKTVEDRCGATTSQLVSGEVVHMNGAVLEWTCSNIFDVCPNSAMTLASTTLFALFSYVVLRLLL